MRIVIDLDDTITEHGSAENYADKAPNLAVVARLREYKVQGFEIIIYSSRNMRTHHGNVGRLNVYTLPGILDWLAANDVPHDEVWIGKPWCGHDGFYVDDRAVRPAEFATLSYDQIVELLGVSGTR